MKIGNEFKVATFNYQLRGLLETNKSKLLHPTLLINTLLGVRVRATMSRCRQRVEFNR